MSSDILDCQVRSCCLIFSVLDCLKGNLEAHSNSGDLWLIILSLRVDAALLALWLLSELVDSRPEAGLTWQSWLLLLGLREEAASDSDALTL